MDLKLPTAMPSDSASQARAVPGWAHALIATVLLTAAVATFGVRGAYRNRFLLGHNDFLQLYSGATLVGTGDLYSTEAVKRVQLGKAGLWLQGVFYSRPPFYAALLRPLASLPYDRAYWVFQAVNLVCCGLFAYIFLLRRNPRYLVWFPLFFPVLVAFANGQDVMIAVFFSALFLTLARKRHDLAAGACLSVCLIKFHLFLFLPLAILAHRRLRILFGGIAGCIAWLALSFAAGGRSWMGEYLNLLLNPDLHPGPSHMPGIFGVVLSFGAPPHVAGVLAAVAGILFAWVLWKVRDFEVAVGLAVVAGLFLALHAYVQDCALLMLALPLLQFQRITGTFMRGFLLTPLPYLATLSGRPWNLVLPVVLLLFSTAAVYDCRRSAGEAR